MAGFDQGYRGTVQGSVQANYTDQPGIAVAGMLAFASDNDLVDSLPVGETNGVPAGAGVVTTHVANTALLNQAPLDEIFLPTVATAADDFRGVVVFDETMQSDSTGVPGVANGRMARLLRRARAGGRIYVKVKEAVVVGTSTVNLVTVAGGTAPAYVPGDFCPTALGGGAAGTSILLSTAKWVTDAAALGLAMLELGPKSA